MTTLQKTLIATALVAAVGTGIYEAHQASSLRDANQALQQQQAPLSGQMQQLQRERDEAKSQLASAQAQLTQLKSNQNKGELLRLRGQVGALQQQLAAGESKASSPASGASKWLSDPSMKEYMRQAAAAKIKSMYAPLLQELKLTPEQRDKFGELYGDHATKFLASISATSQGNAGQAGAAAAPAGELDDLGSQVRSLLGEAGYARFQEFSAEIPARATLSLLSSQLEQGEATPLTTEQSAQLLQIVKAEPRELTSGITGSPDLAFMGSQADIDSFLQRVADSNQRVLQQAGSFLSPDQVGALSTVLSNGITSRKLQAAAWIQRH